MRKPSTLVNERVEIAAWALLGYPLTPQRVTVVKTEAKDSRTDAYCLLSDGTRILRSLVFVNKPRRVKVTDEYGTVTKWQGSQL